MLALAVIAALASGQLFDTDSPILSNPSQMGGPAFLAPLLSSSVPVTRPAGTAVTTTRAGTSYALGGSGVAVSCAANTGCYDSTSGLASNAARTSLWTNPYDASAWISSGSPVVVTNVASGPFASIAGGAEVDTIEDNDAALFEGKSSPSTAASVGQIWTAACYVAADTATTATVRVSVTGGTGTTGAVCSGLTSTFTRCVVTTPALGAGASAVQATLYPQDQDVGADVGTIKVSECELTLTSAAMAPCPGAVCAADVHTVPTTGWPTTSGEVSIKYTAFSSAAPTTSVRLLDSRTTATTHGISLARNTSNQAVIQVYGAALGCTATSAALTWTAEKTLEARWTPTTCEVLENGVSVATGVGTDSPASHAATAFIGAAFGGTGQANGWLNTACVGGSGRCP